MFIVAHVMSSSVCLSIVARSELGSDLDCSVINSRSELGSDLDCYELNNGLSFIIVLWGPATGFLSASEARREWGLTSYFLLLDLADTHIAAFSTHSQTRQRSSQTCCSVTSRASHVAEAIVLSESVCAATLYMCQFEIINQRKRERDFQDVLLITAAQERELGRTARTNIGDPEPK